MTAPPPRVRCARLALAGLVLWLVPFAAAAAPDAPDAPPAADADLERDGPAWPVSWFEVRYEGESEDLPPLSSLLAEPFPLAPTPTGWVAPTEGRTAAPVPLPTSPGDPVQAFHASALGEIAAQIVARLRARGLVGVYVAPDERDIDVQDEADLRRPGDTTLRLRISVGRVREIRSVGFGDRLDPAWRIDNSVHRRIRENSPIQPEELAREGTTSFVDEKALEEYLQRLNRHPGRRVDAALAPAEGGGVDLDYRITEARPWFAYAQSSNTGTKQTNEWQNRFGYVNQQLTNRDDILSIDYLNAGLEDVNAVNLGYEAPWFPSRRPRWLTAEDAPSWLDWLPVESIPWIGWDRLRWRLYGSWSRTLSDDVDGTDDIESIEWDAGFDFVAQIWQHRAFFLDGFVGFRTRAVDNQNDTARNDGSTVYIYLPQVGLRSERMDDVSSFAAEVALEGTANRLGQDADFLGRLEPDRRWLLATWDLDWSHYLEPWVRPGAFADPDSGGSTLAHELAFRTNGQWSFDQRLIPQASQVIGGLFSVRGYPNSIATGDSVVVGTIEYRYHLARSLPVRPRPARLPFLGDFRLAPQQAYGRADWDLVLRVFTDVGRTWRYDRPKYSQEENDTLVGTGVGLELELGGHLRARVDWARAMTSAGPRDDRTDAGDHRFSFLFSVLY